MCLQQRDNAEVVVDEQKKKMKMSCMTLDHDESNARYPDRSIVGSSSRSSWIHLQMLTIIVIIMGIGLSKLLRPVQYQYVVQQEDGSLVDVKESTEGSRILLDSSSHILPFVRVINTLGDPIKRWLVPLDTDTMKQEAKEWIDHEDFGDLADWEAFERLVEVANDRCHLTGRFAIRGMMMMILGTNLKIQKLMKEHPEIHDEKIERPVILAAFTRTGATFLYQVLADIYQQELTPTYSYEIFGGPLDLHNDDNDSSPNKRIQQAEAGLTGLGAMNPPMKLLHEWIAADEPEDEPGWFQHTLTGLVIPFTIPSEWHHAQIYSANSQELNRRLWETLQKIRQWQAGCSGSKKLRFLMKAPEHLFGFPALAKAHPDASFVTVSRDEESWYPSQIVMTQLYQYMFVNAKIEDSIAFTDRLLCEQRRALQIAHNGSYEILPVKFGKYLFTQTLDVVEQIANHADLPWDDNTKTRARDVIAKRLSWKKGNKAAYKLDDFGLTKEMIAERVATICDNLPQVASA